jgi:hypothetical protein
MLKTTFVFVNEMWHLVTKDDIAFFTACGYSTIPTDPNHISNQLQLPLCPTCKLCSTLRERIIYETSICDDPNHDS